LDDLNERLIRVLHSLSFVDDPTRVLRAIRFEQRLNFQLEERTKQLLIESSPLLEQVSGDRLRHEFDLILSGNHCNEILKRLQDLNLFKYIHPELKWDNKKNQVLESALKKTIDELWGIPDVIGNMPAHRFIAYLIIFSSIPPSQINSFSKRLRISATLKSALIQSNTLLAETLHLIKAKPSKVVKMFDKTLPVVLYSLYLMATDKKWQDTIIQFQTKWKHVKTFSNGETLKKMGLSPSPAYHKILFQLRSAWLDDEIHSKDEEVSLLNKLISEIQS
jgi:tRNA nucleotidyltransferase (CCA-adding enzyme)